MMPVVQANYQGIHQGLQGILCIQGHHIAAYLRCRFRKRLESTVFKAEYGGFRTFAFLVQKAFGMHGVFKATVLLAASVLPGHQSVHQYLSTGEA
jgi:hypothetical protein